MLYKVSKMNVPDGQGGRVDKYYARTVTAGRSTLEMIVNKIEGRCTVTRPDILAVLAAFIDDVEDRLQSGQIVELGELGHLQLLVLNRGGADTVEDWTPDLIKKAKIIFRPSTSLQRIANNTSFTRWTLGQTTATDDSGTEGGA